MHYMLLFYVIILFLRVLLLSIFFYVVLFFFTFSFLFDHFFVYYIFFSTIIKFLFIILLFSYLYSDLICCFIHKSLTLFYLFFIYGFVLLHVFFLFLLFQIFFGIFAGKVFFILIFYETLQAQRSVYFKFNKKVDIFTEIPNLFCCKLAVGIYTSIYVCYKILSIFIFIPYLFCVKCLLFLGFCGTLYICFCEIINYVDYKYDTEKYCYKLYIFILRSFEFFLRNVEFTASLLLTFGRILILMVYELVSLRYALPGGIVVCGGPAIIGPSGDLNSDNIPPFDNLTPEESKKLEEKLRNNTSLTVAAYRPLEIVVDLLPENPKKIERIDQYFETIVKNIDVFKTMEKEKYNKYASDYLSRRENPDFKAFHVATPETFPEFLSCITPMIAGSVNEKGDVDAVAVPINGGKAADFVLRGKGIQAKMTSNFSAGNLEEQNQKYKLLIEDENLNFCVRTTYDNLDRADRIQAYIENNKDVLKGQEAVRRQTLPNVAKYAKEYIDFAWKNCEKVQQTQQRIQKEGYLPVIAKEGKQPQLEEIRIKHNGYPAMTKVVKKVMRNGIK